MHLSKRVCEYMLVNVSFNVIWMKRSRNVSVWPLIHVCLYVSEPPWLHFRHEARRQRTIHRPIQPIARPLLETVGLTPRLVAPGATIVTLFGVSTASWKNDSGPWLWMLNTHTHTHKLSEKACVCESLLCVCDTNSSRCHSESSLAVEIMMLVFLAGSRSCLEACCLGNRIFLLSDKVIGLVLTSFRTFSQALIVTQRVDEEEWRGFTLLRSMCFQHVSRWHARKALFSPCVKWWHQAEMFEIICCVWTRRRCTNSL